VVRHVGDDRAAQHRQRVVPADVATRLVRGRVVAVSGVRRQVDAADEGDPVVDDDELLVMAVQRPLLRVGHDFDLRPEAERMPGAVDVAAVGVEKRQRRARPEEHAHGDPLRQLGEQRPELDAPGTPHEREVRCDVPAGEVDVRTGACELLREPRQRLRAVHEHLDGAPGAWRRVSGGPQPRIRRIERALPAKPAQPPGMVRAHEVLGGVAERLVQGEQYVHRHTSSPCSPLLQPR
jgi:hypothetical protein